MKTTDFAIWGIFGVVTCIGVATFMDYRQDASDRREYAAMAECRAVLRRVEGGPEELLSTDSDTARQCMQKGYFGPDDVNAAYKRRKS